MQYIIMDMEKRANSCSSVHNKDASEENNNNNGFGNGNGLRRSCNNKGSSIAERRAGKFNPPSINTARFRTVSPFASPSPSPSPSPSGRLVSPTCLTIPPGISPSALLDSPLMLPNCQAQLSPTTGTFPFPPITCECSGPTSAISDEASNGGLNSRFQPSCYSGPFSSFSALENRDINANKQDKYLMDTPRDFYNEMDSSQEVAEKNSPTDSCSNLEAVTHKRVKASSSGLHSCPYNANNGQVLPDKESTNVYDEGAQNCEGDRKEVHSSLGMGKTAEDGYNWRKYGQKQVKGSEYPRSYYKCTHPSCQVKKKVERSHDGQITEIIYKGAHNHPKPQSIRRGPPGSALSLADISEMGDASGTTIQMEAGPIWRNTPFGARDIKHGSDWRQHDVLNRTSPTSVVTQLSDPLSTNSKGKTYVLESVKTPELSSTLASHDEEDEDGDVQESISIEEEADDEEPEPQRRKLENCEMEPNTATMSSSRAIREPRVVIQIKSDADILEDGYRWRKYGQKVVKGNPNPRSYYKCTTAGCIVRKHVERASHDLKCVLTTYEGKHNHEVPATRSSNHAPSSCGSLAPAAGSTNAILTIPRNPTIPKPEAHVADCDFAPFDRKPEISNELLGSGLFANLCNDIKFGASSMYPMKFPSPFLGSLGRGSFGLNPSQNALHQANPMSSAAARDYPLSLSHKFYNSAKVPMNLSGFDCNNNNRQATAGLVQAGHLGRQITERDMRFLTPKEEKDENLYDVLSPATASSATFYPRILGSFTT